MNYNEIREQLKNMMTDNYKDFVKVIYSIENKVNDEKVLDAVYDKFIENDNYMNIFDLKRHYGCTIFTKY